MEEEKPEEELSEDENEIQGFFSKDAVQEITKK